MTNFSDPGFEAAWRASGAGCWRLASGVLSLDPVAARLLAVDARELRWPQGLVGLSPADALRLEEAHRPGSGRPVRLRLSCGGAPVLWCGGPDGEDGFAGLVMPDAEEPAWPGPQAPPDAFVASVSHELRTPLNAILGFVQLAEAQPPELALRTSLPGIAQSSRLMLRVVNDLLDLATLEAGRLEIDNDQPLSPSWLLTQVCEQAVALRGTQPVRIHAHVDPQCPMHLRGDVGRLHQLLMNLVANALKFTPRGEVVLGVRLRHQDADSVRLRLSVADTGLGMRAAALDRLGQAFERAETRAAGRSGGSGLGLALVRRLLDLHGSRLHLVSVSGGGTLAWFDLVLAIDHCASRQPLVRDTCVVSTDRRVQDSVATQWMAHGQALLPMSQASQAARWLLDADHPRARHWRRKAQREGRELTVFRADPVDPAEAADTVPLPLLASRLWGSAAQLGAARDPLLAGLRVLVVEDNPLSQHVLAEYLALEGAKATLAGDAASALRAAESRGFDVVILDVQLPDRSGFGCAAELRRQLGPACPPLIFLSAHAGPEERLQADALGAWACLSKPFETAQLRALLRRVVQARGTEKEAETACRPDRVPNAPVADNPLRRLFASSWPALRGELLDHAGRPSASCPSGASGSCGLAGTAIRQSLHALRGSLAVMGARDATALAGRLESALLAGHEPSAPDLQRLVALADAWAAAPDPLEEH